MRKILPILKPVICLIASIVICTVFACTAFKSKESGKADEAETVLRIWQIDGFEGGRGSRADYLQKAGNEYGEKYGCYVTVTSLSSDAARLNLAHGNKPDIISYPAGMYGLENYITGGQVWCNGAYCFLTLNGDFSDISADNTVMNAGKENFVKAVSILCGISGCKEEKPTGAYLKLIDGQYKYLLGTQRDVYRLKTRGVSFLVKPVSEYNDLYQNISVVSSCPNKDTAKDYISFLSDKSENITALGLLGGRTVYEDEMKAFDGLDFQTKLDGAVSSEIRKQFEDAVKSGDINMLKSLLK